MRTWTSFMLAALALAAPSFAGDAAPDPLATGDVAVTTLIDNATAPGVQGVKAEHGLSFYIERGGLKILFDVGPSASVIENARALGVDLAGVDMVVLSHVHPDHTGGLAAFLKINRKATVHLHRSAAAHYYWNGAPGEEHNLGLDEDIVERYGDRLRFVDVTTEIAPGVYVMTGFPAMPPESLNPRILRREAGREAPDDFQHEIALALLQPDGVVMFTGCSHHGVVSMVDAVAKQLPGAPIKAVVGGFHLMNPATGAMSATRKDVESIGQALRALHVGKVYTCHCTGEEAFGVLKEVLGDKLGSCATGSRLLL